MHDLLAIARQYDKAAASIAFVTKYKNQIYQAQCADGTMILRLIDSAPLFHTYNPALCDAFTAHMAHMKAMEATPGNYGLTHGDFVLSNYMITDDNRVTVIDFDDCEYAWFAADLAMCLRCYLFWTEDPEALPGKAAEAERMHYHLLAGYKTENEITAGMVYGLEAHIKTRDFIELSQLLNRKDALYDMEKIRLRMCLDRVLHHKPFLTYPLNRLYMQK